MNFKKYYILALAMFSMSNNSHAGLISNQYTWLGSQYTGIDTKSSKSCAVDIENRINSSFFGDKIFVNIAIGSNVKSYALVNHPFFKGSTFGLTDYVYSTEANYDGILVGIVDENWIEITIENSGHKAKFQVIHFGKKQGGLIIAEPRGVLVECILNKI